VDLAGYGAGKLAGKVGSMLVRNTPNPLMSALKPAGRDGAQFLENMGGGPAGLGMWSRCGRWWGPRPQVLRQTNEARNGWLTSEVQSHRDMMDLMHNRAIKASMQSDINDNLARLQSQAPEIYMRVAAGSAAASGGRGHRRKSSAGSPATARNVNGKRPVRPVTSTPTGDTHGRRKTSLLPQYYHDDFQISVYPNAIAAPNDPTCPWFTPLTAT
jgi:hypothetical protein